MRKVWFKVVNGRLISTFIIAVALIFAQHAAVLSQNKNCESNCSCTVEGDIIDASTGEPLPFASILIKGTLKGTQTDERGHFKLTGLCNTELDLIISFIGYKTLTHHHDSYHPFVSVKLAPEEIILESIVVEGHHSDTRMETLVENKLDAKTLQSKKGESLGDILGSITGVNTLKTGQNIVKPIIHGLHSNRVLVINNGIRHENQSWGRQHASEIDPALADNISLVKGAASVKYGPNALGGVVLINPPALELTSHLHGEAVVRGESNGRALDGNISLQQGYDRFVWMVQAAGRKQGDLQAPDYNLTNTGMEEYSAALGMRYHFKKLDITGYYSHISQELGILRGSVVGSLADLAEAIGSPVPENTAIFSYAINNPKQVTSHDLAKLEAVYNFSNSQLDLVYSFQRNARQEYDVRRGTNNEKPSIDLILNSQAVSLEWLHPELAGWNGSIGTEGVFQDNNNIEGTNTRPFIPNFNATRMGFFVNESKTMGKVTYEAGLRYDYQNTSIRGRDGNNNLFFDKLKYKSISAIAGIKWLMSTTGSFHSNLATAWRPPSNAELYAYGKHESIFEYGLWQYTTVNGSDLNFDRVLSQNEKTVGNETGYKWINNYTYAKDNLRLDLVGYANYIRNYIYSRPYGITNTARGPFPYYINAQTDALFLGIDAVMEYRYNSHLMSKLSGNYLWVKDVKFNDRFVGIPANSIAHNLVFTKKGWGFDEFLVELENSYVFRQYNSPNRIITVEEFLSAEVAGVDLLADDPSNFDFIDAPNGYFLTNLSLEGTVSRWVLNLRVKNVFNTSYRDYTNLMRYFADEQGVNFLFSVKVQF